MGRDDDDGDSYEWNIVNVRCYYKIMTQLFFNRRDPAEPGDQVRPQKLSLPQRGNPFFPALRIPQKLQLACLHSSEARRNQHARVEKSPHAWPRDSREPDLRPGRS